MGQAGPHGGTGVRPEDLLPDARPGRQRCVGPAGGEGVVCARTGQGVPARNARGRPEGAGRGDGTNARACVQGGGHEPRQSYQLRRIH